MIEFVCKKAGRLDQLLVAELAGFSRAQVRNLLQDGRVRLNGKRVTTGVHLSPGDAVTVHATQVPQKVPVGQSNLPLDVVHEDDALIFVNKPAGMPCAPLRPDGTGTLANALVARYPELRGVGPNSLEAGLLWRLDNETSGLLAVAHKADAFAALRQQQDASAIAKTYVALVRGEIVSPEGVVDIPIAHDAQDKTRMRAVRSPAEAVQMKARPATTHFVVRQRLAGFTLVACEIHRGARHQIRVHLASLGTPICGDALYDPRWQQRPAPRHFLHAEEVQLVHPSHNQSMRVRAGLPAELVAWLQGIQ